MIGNTLYIIYYLQLIKKNTECRLNTYLNTFQPENEIFLNTMSLSPKKGCVNKKKCVFFNFYESQIEQIGATDETNKQTTQNAKVADKKDTPF